ncbi:MAG: ABC transporter ATP-binding protein [Polyangiales bacterium]
MSEKVVEVDGFVKTFSMGFLRPPARLPDEPPTWLERAVAKVPHGDKLHRVVEAVKGISFDVKRGEIFGFLGPNGAGKTTTIKALLGLIFATRGELKLFGTPVGDPAARRKVGYLPENPYLYQYLTALEIMDLFGRLAGIPEDTRRTQSVEILRRVGLGSAMDLPVRRFSKGMLQRAGLAQALLGDPELLILDEPMTGLDPIGRKEVRDLILQERARGRTVMFSSHILSDVEMLCDRVAIVNRGQLVAYGTFDELLRKEIRAIDIELGAVDDALRGRLAAMPSASLTEARGGVHVAVQGEAEAHDVLRAALDGGARVVSVVQKRETLEDLFVRKAIGATALER